MSVPFEDLLTAQWRRLTAFEREQSTPDRQRRGAFFTPRPLALTVAEAALAGHAADTPLTVFDPCCGAGALLLGVLELRARARATLRAEELNTNHFVSDDRFLGSDVHAPSLAFAAEVLSVLGASCHTQCADTLLDAVFGDCESVDVVVGNPPFGSTRTLARGDSRRDALKARFASIWQDKTEQAGFFVWRAVEWGVAGSWVVPSTLFAGDKTRRFRAAMADTVAVRALELRDQLPFEGVAVGVGLLVHTPLATAPACRSAMPTVDGYRPSDAGPETTRAALRLFATGAAGPEIEHQRMGQSARWLVLDPDDREVATLLSRSPRTLGSVFHVGKGMETGCNRAFELPASLVASLTEAERCFVRRRIRGSEIEARRVRPGRTWMLYTPAAAMWEALPACLQGHLLSQKTALRTRAAYRRGDCEWWRYTWPLHREWYHRYRVMTPYRAASHRFAMVGPGDGVGLTDTTAVFVEGETAAEGLVRYLNSRPVARWYRGNTKHTGGRLMEFFENQLRSIPVPSGFEVLLEQLAALPEAVDETAVILSAFEGSGTDRDGADRCFQAS